MAVLRPFEAISSHFPPCFVTKRLTFEPFEACVNDGDELLEGLEPEALLRACEGMVRSCRRRCPQTVRAFGLGILGIFMLFFLDFS